MELVDDGTGVSWNWWIMVQVWGRASGQWYRWELELVDDGTGVG